MKREGVIEGGAKRILKVIYRIKKENREKGKEGKYQIILVG